MNGLSFGFDAVSIIMLLVKLTIVLGIALLLSSFSRQRTASFRHAILTLGLICVPILTGFHFFAPAWSVPYSKFSFLQAPVELELAIQPTKFRSEHQRNSKQRPPPADDDSIANAPRHDENANTSLSPKPNFRDSANRKIQLPIESKMATQANDSRMVRSSIPPIQTELNGNVANPREVSELLLARNRMNIIGRILLVVWCVGTLLLLSRILLAWLMVSRVVKSAQQPSSFPKYKKLNLETRTRIQQINSCGIQVKVSDSTDQSPLGIGVFKRTILLPLNCFQWNDQQWKSVLLHEFAHFRRHDCLINLLARFKQALLWFHPLAWLYVGKIREESENSCDDFVIQSGVSKIEYADILVNVARNSVQHRHMKIATVTMSDTTPLESRIETILSSSTQRHPLQFRTLALVVLLLIGISIPVATAQLASSRLASTESKDSVQSQQPRPKTESATTINAGDRQAGTPEAPLPTKKSELGFLVTLEDGQTFVGRHESELEVESDFGRSYLKTQQIRLIQPSDNDPQKFKIEANDGSVVFGKIKATTLTFKTDSGKQVIVELTQLKSAALIGQSNLISEEISNGFASNQTTYHIRAPKNYDPAKKYPAIVLLHGSNSNSKTVIEQVASDWPRIADRYLLVGINGERTTNKSDSDSPTYKYTYVNFAGASKYKGFPGTERESPALVAEVLKEIRDYVPISTVFLGGSSDGGWLTYSMYMNYPNLIDGAFPIAGAMIIQCEPDAYDNPEIRRQQRDTPLAIVHPEDDRTLQEIYTTYAHKCYLDDAFPMVRVLAAKANGHEFGGNNFSDAIEWLETMSVRNNQEILVNAESLLAKNQIRDAIGLMTRINTSLLNESEKADAAFFANKNAAKVVTQFESSIDENTSNSWIDEFLEFRLTYEFSPIAVPVMKKFEALRSAHDPQAEKLYKEALSLFDKNQDDVACEKCQKIIDEYYASKRYHDASQKLTQRRSETGDN